MKAFQKRLLGQASTVALKIALRWMSKKDAIEADMAGAKLGRLAFRFAKKHRYRTRENLKLAFPEMDEAEREQLAIRVFEHFGRVTTDFLRIPSRSNEEVIAAMTSENLEGLDRLLQQGKGVIAITAHFGNWERMAQFYTAMGKPLAVVARDANAAGLNQLVNELRSKVGLEVIPRGSGRQVLTTLRANRLVAILPDQNSGESFLPFFGHPCGTVLGPGVLALRTGAPVVTSFCYRTGPGTYHSVTGPEIVSPDGTAEGLMGEVNKAIEAMIRQHPEQYLWLHDRWKSARQQGLLG